MPARFFSTYSVALSLFACACSDNDDGRSLPDPGPVSGVDRETPYAMVPPDELDMLCEWTAGRIGGWGHRATCGDGSYLTASRSLAECHASYSNFDFEECPYVVGDLEDCVNGIVDGCPSLPSSCLDLASCAF